MKKIIAVYLSMIMFFMLVDFPSIKSIVTYVCLNNSQITSTQLLNAQYEIYEKAKNMVVNIGNILIHDLQIIITTQQNDLYFNFINNIFISSAQFIIMTHNKFILSLCSNKYFICVQKNSNCYFLILLIILFMLKYLGLLIVYWNYKYISNNINEYIKLLFYMLFLFANKEVYV